MPMSLSLGLGLTAATLIKGGGVASSLKPVAGRTFVPNEFGGDTNKQVMVQTRHILAQAVKGDLEVWWANWRATGGLGEFAPANSASGRASILWHKADGTEFVTRMVAVADGSDTAAAAAGANLKLKAAIDAPAGSQIIIRFWGNFPDGMNYGHWQADYTNGDVFSYGAAVTDLTGTKTAFSDTWQGVNDLFAPVFIGAITTAKTVGICGDSRDSGLNDRPDNIYGHIGQLPRLMGPRLAYTNVSVPGAMASELADPVRSARRRALLVMCDYLAIGLGVNDIIPNGGAAAATLALNQQVAEAIGKPTLLKTLDPWTIGGNVTKDSDDSKRVAYNVAVRAQPAWAVGFYDPASVLETAGNVWVNASYVLPESNGDWVHESNVGNAYAAANAGFDFAKVGSPAAITLFAFTLNMLGSQLLGWYKPGTPTVSLWDDEGSANVDLVQATGAAQPVPDAGGGVSETNLQFYGSALVAGSAIQHAYWIIAFDIPTLVNTRYLLDSSAGAGGLQVGINASGQVFVNDKNASNFYNTAAIVAGKHIFAFKTAATGAGTRAAIDGNAEAAGFGAAGWTGAGTIKLGPAGVSGSPGKILGAARLDPSVSSADLAKAIGALAWDCGVQAALASGFAYKGNRPIL